MHNNITLVIGPKGSGKSYETVKLIGEQDRVAVFDMVHETSYETERTTVITGEPKKFYEFLRDNDKFDVTYRPVVIIPEENGLVDSPEFEPFVKTCFGTGNMTMVIDEAHLLCNSRNCPKALMISNLIGRHRRLSLLLVAQSFTGIHPAIRKNADDYYFWRIIEPSDLDGIANRCGKEVAEQVQALRGLEVDRKTREFKREGQMLHWSKSEGVMEITE